jgi:hypothetical protein
MMYQDSVIRDFNLPFAMVLGSSGKDNVTDRSVPSVIKVSLCCWSCEMSPGGRILLVALTALRMLLSVGRSTHAAHVLIAAYKFERELGEIS